jgi:DNA invertase Pin-like site-specific DNA recombinase
MRSRWVLWAAVSSLPQAKRISNDDQLRLGREHAARHGGQIVSELVVPGESRSIILLEDAARRIDAYAQLREMIDGRAFDVLAYLDRSRLGRKASLSMAVVELCHEADILPYEIDNPPATLDIPRDYDGDLLGAIKSVGAQQEIRKLVARRASGMLGRAKRGLNPVNLPFGYVVTWRVENAQRVPEYAIDEPAAEVVRRIFAAYLAGRGRHTIAAELTAIGAPHPSGGDAWTHHSVANTIRRVWRYAGFVEVNAYYKSKSTYFRGPGAWPALIDEATANAVVAERQARNVNRHIPDTPYTLTGLCYCGACGRSLSVHKTTNSVGSTYYYMRCQHHTPQVRIPVPLVIDMLRTLIDDLRTRGIDAYLDAADTDATDMDAQRKAQHVTLADVARRKARADTAYVDGNLDADEYTAQVRRLRNAEAEANAELTRLDDMAATAAQRGTRRDRLEQFVNDGLAMLDRKSVV